MASLPGSRLSLSWGLLFVSTSSLDGCMPYITIIYQASSYSFATPLDHHLTVPHAAHHAHSLVSRASVPVTLPGNWSSLGCYTFVSLA
jgi:hypothetical protein